MDNPNDAPRQPASLFPSAAEVSHALRTPLTVVAGNVQLAARLLAREGGPDRDGALRALAAAARAAEGMVRELDRFDRPALESARAAPAPVASESEDEAP